MWEGVTVVKKCDSPKEVLSVGGEVRWSWREVKGHKVYHLA